MLYKKMIDKCIIFQALLQCISLCQVILYGPRITQENYYVVMALQKRMWQEITGRKYLALLYLYLVSRDPMLYSQVSRRWGMYNVYTGFKYLKLWF